MMQGNIDILLHEEDDRVISGEFQFSDSMFDLVEPIFRDLSKSFYTPSEKVNKDFENYSAYLKIGHLNTSSIPKHRDDISNLMLNCDFDAFGTCETFIKQHTPKSVFHIEGYQFFSKNRDVASKGGVGLYVKNTLKAKRINLPSEPNQPEVCFIEITVGTSKIAIGEVYKSPLIPYGVFGQLHETLAFLTSRYTHTIIMGDFNIDHLKLNTPALNFLNSNVVEPFALTQVIEEPTRITENTSSLIDLVLTGAPENIKTTGVVDVPGISDHSLVYFSYALKKPKYKPKMITRRDLKSFKEEAFVNEVAETVWDDVYTAADTNEKSQLFEREFSNVLDKHAPFKTFRVTRPPSPWLTQEIKQQMDNRDRYKNKFNQQKQQKANKQQLSETYNIYQGLRNKVTHMIRASKIKMFNDKINTKIKNPKAFHAALKEQSIVDNKRINSSHPPFDPTKLNKCFLANNNAKIDDSKIDKEVQEILKNSLPPSFKFREVTEGEITKVIKSIKTNACGVDKISAYFLKLGIAHIVKPLTNIVNSSFKDKIFPSRWKMALVKPLPKINIPIEPSDFRPISLLPAISKIMEKIAAKQMVDYLKRKNLLDTHQSAYKHNHSTLTALLNITDDIYDALENTEITLLILLDYSKAFDCANHKLILAKLQKCGFHTDSLGWLNSYLSKRSQQVVAEDQSSPWEDMLNGVPQGSILGPLLFTILISDIKNIIKHGKYHLYADDTQLYYRCKVSEISDTIKMINKDLDRVSNFSMRNCLKLNNGKSNYIIIGSRQNLTKLSEHPVPPVMIGNNPIERKIHVKNLGVIFDETLSWDKHINKCIGKAYGKFKQAFRFKKFLSQKAKLNISETYILSQFNYCDALFLNSSKILKNKIQKVQNSCLRFALDLRKYEHITIHRKKLDLLSMDERRSLHSLTLMHKIVKQIAPSYLCTRIKQHVDIHNYRTRNRLGLAITNMKTAKKSNSFFGSIQKLYNSVSGNLDMSNFSINVFKTKCEKYLVNL